LFARPDPPGACSPSGGDSLPVIGDHRPGREARSVRERRHSFLLARRTDPHPHPGLVHLPARLREQALPGGRRIHWSRQGERALPGRGRPFHLRVAARQAVPSVDEAPSANRSLATQITERTCAGASSLPARPPLTPNTSGCWPSNGPSVVGADYSLRAAKESTAMRSGGASAGRPNH
jgi:hypothetical protein